MTGYSSTIQYLPSIPDLVPPGFVAVAPPQSLVLAATPLVVVPKLRNLSAEVVPCHANPQISWDTLWLCQNSY